MTWLLIYVLAISLYDVHTRRIPNWCTLPVILAGMVANFPGHFDLWLASLCLVSAWTSEWMGAGDVKLWLALFWALPVEFASQALPFMFISFLLSSAAQILWRVIKQRSTSHVLTPAAWRTIPFILMCWYVH